MLKHVADLAQVVLAGGGAAPRPAAVALQVQFEVVFGLGVQAVGDVSFFAGDADEFVQVL